jgi:hypothetical protein
LSSADWRRRCRARDAPEVGARRVQIRVGERRPIREVDDVRAEAERTPTGQRHRSHEVRVHLQEVGPSDPIDSEREDAVLEVGGHLRWIALEPGIHVTGLGISMMSATGGWQPVRARLAYDSKRVCSAGPSGPGGGPGGGGFGGGQATLVQIAGASGVTTKDETRQVIIDEYVPVGARSFKVASARAFKRGDTVIVRRFGNDEWIAAVGMNGETPLALVFATSRS